MKKVKQPGIGTQEPTRKEHSQQPVEIAADAESHKKAPAEVAGGVSVEVAADASCRKVKTQRQMAGQMTSSVWHLLTQRHRRYQSDARATS